MVSTYTFPGPNMTPAETWSIGHRTPYGLAFSPTGELWEVEHGPRGGDELNLIEKGKNYGWPLVSYGQNYNGVPIANPDTRQFQPLAFARNFQTPERAYKWESSVTVPFKNPLYSLTALYTGNLGRNLPLAGIANQIIRVETNPDPTQPAIVVRQFDIIRNSQVLKPFGEF